MVWACSRGTAAKPCNALQLGLSAPADAGLPEHVSLQNRTSSVNDNLGTKPLSSGWLTMSGPGEVRIGPILALPEVLAELGVSPELAIAKAGVEPLSEWRRARSRASSRPGNISVPFSRESGAAVPARIDEVGSLPTCSLDSTSRGLRHREGHGRPYAASAH
jgi:hypothetical protein